VDTATAFDHLVDSYLDLKWQINPVDATAVGLAQHDHRLGAFGQAEMGQYLAALKSVAGALEGTTVDSLADEIDRTALLNDARVTAHVFHHERPHERNPAFWVTHALDGLYLLLVARDRSREHRGRAAGDRIRAIPGFLESAKETLKACPTVFIDTAGDVARAGDTLIDQVAKEIPPSGDESFGDACADAKVALEAFVGHLESIRSGASDGEFAIGEVAFNFRLCFEHALRATAPELWRYGNELVEQVESEVAEIASRVEAGVAWPEVVDRLRGVHPDSEGIVAAYAAQMDRSRTFVQARDLVEVPDGRLEVVETPDFLRPLIPFAAYQPPGAFAADRTGWFYVTPPAADADDSTRERILRDHCTHELAATALHEGYPGHHLQFLSAFAQPRKTRKVIGSPVSVEGWALYCEEMMGEEGFYGSDEERLFQRLALLWRAVRIVLDVGLHTRGMSFDQAVQILTDRMHFDRANAEAEVRRYCAHPVYQLCYAVGLRELKALRRDYRAAVGSDYSLKQFHSTVLEYGGLPVSLMRWGMGLVG
jgi:hypothetical protein